MKVLFVCRANAGRSQMAEALYNAQTKTQDATSAGLDLKNSVKGDDPTIPELVIAVMQELGLDVSAKRRKFLTSEMVDAAEKVIVMTDYQLPDYLLKSEKLILWDGIPDAVRTPIEFHRKVRDLVHERVKKLVETT